MGTMMYLSSAVLIGIGAIGYLGNNSEPLPCSARRGHDRNPESHRSKQKSLFMFI
jgi:hypothetical protein